MQVTIGPEFFKKARHDYNNWLYAWIREILQNAMDSGASQIDIQYETISESEVKATVCDNGRGMTRDVLIEKLFSLGSSGKSFAGGAVGGFGKAKELLYFGQNKFVIETNNLTVMGVGGDYSIIEAKKPRHGTQSTVYIDVDSWRSNIQVWIDESIKLIEWSAFKGHCTINGFSVRTRSLPGLMVKEFTCGKLYRNTNLGAKDKIIYRVNGSPMFAKNIKNLGQGLILEIEPPSIKHLASNRDGLVYDAQNEIDPFVNELTIDKRTALLKQASAITMYGGKRGRLRMRPRQRSLDFDQIAGSIVEASMSDEEKERIGEAWSKTISGHEIVAKVDFQQALTEFDFMVNHSKVEPLPEKWTVGSLCENALWVAWAWSAAVWEVYVADGREPDFTFGFIFDDDFQAKYVNGAYLINPCHTDYKIKYTRTRKCACDILTLAAHEYAHGLGYIQHDEDYAAALTEVMRKVMFESPHAITKMLSRDHQEKMDYEDSQSYQLMIQKTAASLKH